MAYKFRYWQGVKYVAAGNPAPENFARCGHCGRAWDDSKPTAWTPAPSARCPFEYMHRNAKPQPPAAEDREHIEVDSIALLLWDYLKRDPEHKDRRRTGYGTKTKLGLLRSIKGILSTVASS